MKEGGPGVLRGTVVKMMVESVAALRVKAGLTAGLALRAAWRLTAGRFGTSWLGRKLSPAWPRALVMGLRGPAALRRGPWRRGVLILGFAAGGGLFLLGLAVGAPYDPDGGAALFAAAMLVTGLNVYLWSRGGGGPGGS